MKLEKLIASYGKATNLVVHEDYRGQGIATQVAIYWRTRKPDYDAGTKRKLTPAGKKIVEKVYEALK